MGTLDSIFSGIPSFVTTFTTLVVVFLVYSFTFFAAVSVWLASLARVLAMLQLVKFTFTSVVWIVSASPPLSLDYSGAFSPGVPEIGLPANIMWGRLILAPFSVAVQLLCTPIH